MGLTKPRAAQIFNLDYKQSTRVVTTTNITLSGGAPSLVDGVTLSLGDRVLVTAQSTGSQNGLYYVTTLGSGANGTWTRTSDGNENGEIEAGMIVMVTEGVIYADTQWKLITDDPIVINTTALTFTQNYSANSISSGSSNVVVNSNANVTVSSAGTANVLTVSSTGAVVSGTLSVTGNLIGAVNATANITAGNIRTLGVVSATGDVFGKELWSTQSSGDDGGQVNLSIPAANTALTGQVTIDVYQNQLRFFQGDGARGAYIDLTQANVGVGTNLLASGGGGGTPGGANTNVQFNDAGLFGGTAGLTFNKTTNAVATTGTFSATGNITGGNLIAGTGASGNITGANVITANTVTATANITGGNILTSGLISAASVVGGVITGSSVSVTGAQTAASTVGGVITGSSVSVTGTQTAASTVGGVMTGSSVSVTGAVTGASLAGAITTAAQTNITSVGTLSALSVTGNVQGGNLRTAGLVSATGSVTAASVVGGVITGTSASVSGAVTGASLVGTITTAAQTNITSVGTLGALSVTGNITFGGSLVDTGALELVTGSNGNITLSPNGSGLIVANKDIRNGQANGVGNIGTVGGFFNTIFAKSTSAQYADLAEKYTADAEYAPGTVIEFGGPNEVTITTQSHSAQVAGIVSTNPSYLMNSGLVGQNVIDVALVGRVPCQVVGTIAKGDRLVASSTPGVATRLDMSQYQPGCIIGKAMQNYNSNQPGIIEVAVGRF
jgi:hypothetical protein